MIIMVVVCYITKRGGDNMYVRVHRLHLEFWTVLSVACTVWVVGRAGMRSFKQELKTYMP
jgi:hypothetical protein